MDQLSYTSNFNNSPNVIVATMQNMQVTNMDGICYKSTYKGSQILTALNTIYPMSQLDHK